MLSFKKSFIKIWEHPITINSKIIWESNKNKESPLGHKQEIEIILLVIK